MHALIVLAHPEPHSFNAQLKDTAVETLKAQGHTVEVSDLYAQGFDPAEGPRHFARRARSERFGAQTEQRHAHETGTTGADVAAEIAKLGRADFVLFQYPIWWFGMPAMLKGWIDRVFTFGGIYTAKQRYENGKFLGKRAMLSVTAGAPEPSYNYNGRSGELALLLWPMHKSLVYVGYQVLPPFLSAGIQDGIKYDRPVDERQRVDAYKKGLADRLGRLDEQMPLPFNMLADFDDSGRLKPGAPAYSPFIRAEP
ncbi:MAG: NAD(P)H-dependent oxidoreductase [Alphaproteobacteria bacterium]|nr:NAD(P)H-dependent oxidoreductase [Alphaproteobacteria bacterium]